MDGMRFTYSVHLHGTLSANARGEYKLPCGATLEAVSVCASTATNATLEVGTSADRDGIWDAVACGTSGTPNEFRAADHNGALVVAGVPYHFAKGDILVWDLDFDGASGTAAANATIVFTLIEG